MTEILGVMIGLVMVYVVLSLVCSAVSELIAATTKARQKDLASGIEALLKDPKITDLWTRFQAHPLVASLHQGKRKPSYLPAATFTDVLLDLLVPPTGEARTGADVLAAVKALDADSTTRRMMLSALTRAGGSMDALKTELGGWFDGAMEVVSGWYKRWTHLWLVAIGVLVCVIANADTIRIAKTLANDKSLREAIVAKANDYAEKARNTPTKTAGADADPKAKAAPGVELEAARKRLEAEVSRLNELGIPLGWDNPPSDAAGWFSAIVGILISAFAVSLGAPFWFDMLNRVINIRAASANPLEPLKGARRARS